MKALVGNAYAGSGTPKFAPVYVKSDKTAKTTQTLVDGADKFSMSLADVDKKREATLSMVITGDVNITYTIISTTPAVDAQHLECYKTDQKIVTTVAGIPMTTEIVQKQCYIRLSKAPDPEIMLVYGVLVPDDPVNVSGKNAGDEQITFEIQTAATTTYCIQAQHLLVNNMGFAALAEQKIQAQPPVVAAKFYSVVTGQ